MSGHSRWHKVKQYKGGIDAKRASVFTKLAKNITVAARLGGGNPDFNFSLRMAIDRAKMASVPKDVIERAVKRGTGELEGGAVVEAVYEAFGPEKCHIIIVCQTDNTNRALSMMKDVFSKKDVELAQQGAVMWNFDKKGVIVVKKEDVTTYKPEELELLLIDAGAEDIITEDEVIRIITAPTQYGAMLKALDANKIPIDESALEYLSKDEKQLSEESQQQLEATIEALEELDDVDAVYTNAGF